MCVSIVKIVSGISSFFPEGTFFAHAWIKEKSRGNQLVSASALNGLSENWWMQIIDGRDHQHGPYVYDLGLHGRTREKGYYKGILAGHCVLLQCVHEPLSVALYSRVHRAACSFFPNVSNGETLVTIDRINVLGSENVRCRTTLDAFELPHNDADFHNAVRCLKSDKAIIRHSLVWHLYDAREKDAILKALNLGSEEAFKNKASQAIDRRQWVYQTVSQRIEEMNAYIKDRAAQLELPPFAQIELDWGMNREDQAIVDYLATKKGAVVVEFILKKLFSAYEEAMKSIFNSQIKAKRIAALFQDLDLLHPFPDGQGRTDLLILSKELSRHGLNPPILPEPYFSTFFPLDVWAEYLQEGMQRWRQKALTLFPVSF